MAANIVILAFCSVMTWLLYRFKLAKAGSRAEVRKLLPFFLVLGVFLAFNALLAFMGRGGLNLAVTMTPITLRANLEDIATGDGVMLDGVVSAQNPTNSGESVAYIDDVRLWSPSELLIELDDGVVTISNDTYAARNWPRDSRSFPHLKRNDPVIVLGTVERSVTISGSNKGQEHLSLQAQIVYAGDHAGFVARAKRQILLPTGLFAVNVLATVVVVAVPLGFWLRRS